MEKTIIQQMKNLVDQSERIAIFGHDNPDGDALGSMLGLGGLLEKMNKKVFYFASPKTSVIYDFLPGIKKVQTSFDYSNRYDLLIFVDFSPYTRTVFSAGKYDYFDNKKLLIFDHHIGDTPSHALVLKDDQADSNCEWIFENTKEIWAQHYDATIATYLYMGLITDTGNFQYDKQQDRSLRNAADLVLLGADKKLLTRHFFGTLQLEQLQFFNKVFPRLKKVGNIGSLYFTAEDYLPLGLDKEQAGGYLVAMIQKIAGIDFFLICRGDDNALKISFRSKNDTMSAETAAASLGGGGHFYAAGAKVLLEPGEDPLEKIDDLVALIPTLF